MKPNVTLFPHSVLLWVLNSQETLRFCNFNEFQTCVGYIIYLISFPLNPKSKLGYNKLFIQGDQYNSCVLKQIQKKEYIPSARAQK